MASISRDKKGRRIIQFVGKDGKRKSIRLGKLSQRVADEIKLKVEAMNAAAIANSPLDTETAQWVSKIGVDLAEKLAAVGLIAKRGPVLLGKFLTDYIDRRKKAKPNTRRNLEAAKARLIEFFAADKDIRDITSGDAENWLLWLQGHKEYADGTTGRTVKRAKQFFRFAVSDKILIENPFDRVKAPSQVNKSREFFVTREMAEKVLDMCPNAEWRLIFALCRYGGLRCPSELLRLKWTDINWEKDRFLVHSSKTEHLESGGDRWVPIFPELRPYLDEADELAEDGAVYVINRYRDTNTNLRTQLLRIIEKAGLAAWPKLFQNLRATRETELAAEYPIHVVCAWIGNTEKIAAKHYLQITDDDFERAAKSGAVALQNPVQQPAAPSRTVSPKTTEASPEAGFPWVLAAHLAPCGKAAIPPRGLEPLS